MWQINKEKDWHSLQKFEWVKDMKGVSQDSIHHAEGDVDIHTRMVIDALEDLPEYQSLDAQTKEILWASALLHDVEKRSTTFTDEQGRITSPGHAKKGALTSRQILYKEIDTPFEIREQIVGLVRHHGLPLWSLSKENPQKSLLQASLEVNTEWVAILAKADVLGRICADKADLLYRIELFKEFCIENNCWGSKKVFPSDSSKFEYFRKEEQSPDYAPFENTGSQVIMLSGLAGAGKDHYIQRNHKDTPVISLDDMRRSLKIHHNDKTGNGQVIQQAKEEAKKYLRNKENFTWNATNITTQMRKQLIDLFATYNAKIKIVYLEVPYKQLLSQNKARANPIPETGLIRMVGKLEVPAEWEAHEVIWVVK